MRNSKGQFVKGEKPWNVKEKVVKTCKICCSEMYLQPSVAKRKTLCSKECNLIDMRSRKNMLGKFHTDEVKKKLSETKIGIPSWNKGLKGFRAGEKHDWMPAGDNHWSWKGGISKDVHSTSEPKYKEWRMSVFKRDNFSCRIADNNCEGQLQAHHILRWADYPELRYEINNGITLCIAYHPRKIAEEKRLAPTFMELVSVSKDTY